MGPLGPVTLRCNAYTTNVVWQNPVSIQVIRVHKLTLFFSVSVPLLMINWVITLSKWLWNHPLLQNTTQSECRVLSWNFPLLSPYYTYCVHEAHSNKVNGDFTIFKNALIANESLKIPILFSPNDYCMKWFKGTSDGLCKQRIVEHIATSLE